VVFGVAAYGFRLCGFTLWRQRIKPVMSASRGSRPQAKAMMRAGKPKALPLCSGWSQSISVSPLLFERLESTLNEPSHLRRGKDSLQIDSDVQSGG